MTPTHAVRVVVYEDLQCPDCAVYQKMLDDQLLPRYGGAVAFEHRDFPLPKHAAARPAAMAARSFAQVSPDLGLAFRRHCFARLRQVSFLENMENIVREFAHASSADGDKALAALHDPALAKLIDSDYQEGLARGVVRTPTVFVNEHPFVEHFTFEEISKSIDAALAAFPQPK